MAEEVWIKTISSVVAAACVAAAGGVLTWVYREWRQFQKMSLQFDRMIEQLTGQREEQKTTNKLLTLAMQRLDSHEDRLDNHDDIINKLWREQSKDE